MAIKHIKLPNNTTVDVEDARISVFSPSNGQVLKYNSTSGKFENANESGGGGDITDVLVDNTSVVISGVAYIPAIPVIKIIDET